ncbi:MAG: glycosyltransferase [Verrucomicrobia bacterium]|nr:glycosyltransferase [Verrucomicrobiota bacterium]
MKLVLVVPTFPKLSETFIVSKFLGLLGRGWDAHVVCDSTAPEEWSRFPELDRHPTARQRVHRVWPHRPRWQAAALTPVALARCALANPAGALRGLNGRAAAAALRQLYLDAEIIALKPDLIHFEFGVLARGRVHLKSQSNCRLVTSFRGYDLNYCGLEEPNYYAEVWRAADALHLLGEDLWRRAQARGCPPDKPHALIPPAIDAEFFAPAPRSAVKSVDAEQPLRILSVGRLEWKKGYEHALLAVQKLAAQGVRCEYHIVGGGSYHEPVAFARHQLGLDEVVQLHGDLSRTEVKEQMQQADVFLHAAVSEGFCNAVLEAQAMQLPVVCSDADGLPENVAHGETGFVVPRRDSAALAERLAALAQSPQLRIQLGCAGRARVCARFRLADQISAFERLYQQVLNSNASAGPRREQ